GDENLERVTEREVGREGVVDDGVDDHGFGFFPLHALSGWVVTIRPRFCSVAGPVVSTAMQTTYRAPSLRVTFSHAVRTSSVPLQLPMRSTFWMSPDTARMSRTRSSASRRRAALTPAPPHPAANASTQPLTMKPSRAVTSLKESDVARNWYATQTVARSRRHRLSSSSLFQCADAFELPLVDPQLRRKGFAQRPC